MALSSRISRFPHFPNRSEAVSEVPRQQGRKNKREREQYTTLTRQTKAGESITQGEYLSICLRARYTMLYYTILYFILRPRMSMKLKKVSDVAIKVKLHRSYF